MPRLTFRRRLTPAMARARSHRPRIELLEDRVAPASSLTSLATFTNAAHGPYDPPVVDSAGDVYTFINTNGPVSLHRIAAGSKQATTIAPPEGYFFLDSFGSGGINGGLAADSAGDIFGPIGGGTSQVGISIFEIPAGSQQIQIVPADLGGAYLQAENLQSLAVANGSIYGLMQGAFFGSVTPAVEVFQVPVAGGILNPLGVYQFPASSDFVLSGGDGLTVKDGFVYGVTVGTVPGTVAVFSVPVGGVAAPPDGSAIAGPLQILSTFPGAIGTGLVVDGGYVYGTIRSNNSLFKVPIAGGKPTYFPISIGQAPLGGLVDDEGTVGSPGTELEFAL